MLQLFYAYLGAVLLHRGFDVLHDFVRRLLFHADSTLYSTIRPLSTPAGCPIRPTDEGEHAEGTTPNAYLILINDV